MSEALEAAQLSPLDFPAEEIEGFASFAEPKLPVQAGRFMLRSRLGYGGMGTVYEAEDEELQRVVALKMIRSQHFAGASEKQRFKREALAAAKLDHPHIVPMYETGELDGCSFLTMKLIRGGTLADLMSQGPLPADQAVGILAKMAAALQHAHDQGVLHRDLKPSNILIDEQGKPWLTDFGLARLRTGAAHETLHGAQIGTPMYMAPEQAAGRSDEVGAATDVWALGVLLYQMLSGRTPYEEGENLAVIQRVISEPQPRLEASTPREKGLAALIERCLQKEPAKRMPSAGFLAEELERWLEGGRLITQRRLQKRLLVKLAAMLALAAALAGWWLWPPADDYVISRQDGVLVITSRGKENGWLNLISSAETGTLTAAAEGRRFRVDGALRMEDSGALPLKGLRRLVIESGDARDDLKFRGKLILDKDASLEVRPETAPGGYCEVYVDQRAEVRTSGTGSISFQGTAGITVDTDAVLEVENGPLNLSGNWPRGSVTKSFSGVIIEGPVQSTGTGVVTVRGRGGNQPKNLGVAIAGGRVSGGRSGSSVTVEGESGAGGGSQAGVSVMTSGQITSLGADVWVKGRGHGDGSGAMNYGVDVRTGGEISAGGPGKVQVEGIGGRGSRGANIGVHVLSGGRILSHGGPVVVSGTAGENGVGVRLSEGSIRAGGRGSVSITGTGSLNGGKIEDAYGVELRKKPGTLITTEGGEISITGKGGSAEAADILVAAGVQITTQEHGGKITLNGERQSLAPGSVKEGVVAGEGPKPDWIVFQNAGVLRVQDNTDLGGVLGLQETAPGQIELILAPESVVLMPDSSRLSGGTVPLSLAGIQQLHLHLGDGDDRLEFHGFTGDSFPSVSVDAGPGDDLVQFRGLLSLAEDQSVHLELHDDAPEPGADSVEMRSGSSIVTRGKGAITMRASRKILLTDAILRTMDGDITLEANQQARASTGNFRGVDLIGSQLISEGAGGIAISGRGGNEGNFQFGISVGKASVIQGGSSGRVSLKGAGGDNGLNDNSGIALKDKDCQILSRGADIELHGRGMGKPGSGYNFGLALVEGRIAAEGAGKVTLTGHGGHTLGWHSAGVLVRGAVVTSENGPLTLTGRGGGTSGGKGGGCDGVLMVEKARVGSMGSGSVTVDGTGGAGAAEEHTGVSVYAEGQISSSGGPVKVTGTGGAGGAGVLLSGGSLQSGGKGTLTVTGTGGSANASGLVLVGEAGTLITTAGGDALLTGIAGSPETAAISAQSPARITASGQGGKIRLIGTKTDLAAGTVDPDAEVKAHP
jgi:hypothetical protein